MTLKTDVDILCDMLLEVKRIRSELVELTEATGAVSGVIEQMLQDKSPSEPGSKKIDTDCLKPTSKVSH